MVEKWTFVYNYGVFEDEPEESGVWDIDVDRETFFKLLNKFLEDINPHTLS